MMLISRDHPRGHAAAAQQAAPALAPDLQRFAVLLRRALGVRDVRVAPSGRDRALYLLGAPRTLLRLLGRGGSARRFMLALDAKKGRDDWRWRDVDTWDDLQSAVTEAMAELVPSLGQGVFSWAVYPVPAPGGVTRRSWSAVKGRWLPPDRVPRFRLCEDGPKLDVGRGPSGPLLLHAGWWEETPPFFLSHSLKFRDLALAERCGGLLWPSFALAWKVPPGYGPVAFLASVDAAYDATRGTTLHPTDAWSPDTRWLQRYEKARNLEQVADPAWWRGEVEREAGGWGQRGLQEDLLASGIKPEDIGGQGWAPTQSGDLITSKTVLMRRMRKLLDVHEDWLWEYPADVRDRIDDWDAGAHSPRGDFYPYLELKAAGVVRVGSLAACFYPARRHRAVGATLDRLGFRGWRVPYRWSGPLDADYIGKSEEAALATRMTEAIRAFTADPCALGLPVPEALRGWSASRRYRPAARLVTGYDYASGMRGVAWVHGGGCGGDS